MRFRAVIALLAIFSVAVIVTPGCQAAAQGLYRVQMRGVIATCSTDYARLCPGVRPGGGRIIACLNAQAEKLSQPCFQALAQRGLAFAAALRLCRSDYERLCRDVPTGMGRVLACLLERFDQVSSNCREALSAHGFREPDDEAPRPGPQQNREERPAQRP